MQSALPADDRPEGSSTVPLEAPDTSGSPAPVTPPEPAPPEPAPPPVFERLPSIAPTATAAQVAKPASAAAAPLAGADDRPSAVADEPLPAPGRRSLKKWLLALVAFILLVIAIGGALVWYGPPDWLPLNRSTFAKARPGLVLDFPKANIERKTLADGTEFFGARGTITNTGSARQSVPPLLIVLRDRQSREVYRWEVDPPKQQLGPGETMTINQAVTDIPRSATVPEIGWKSA